MFIAKDKYRITICARCGSRCTPTKDHYIPKSCRMTVNENGNYVGLCVACNREKASRIVLPDWYRYLGEKEKSALLRYFRYASIYIKDNCDDVEVLEFLEMLE